MVINQDRNRENVGFISILLSGSYHYPYTGNNMYNAEGAENMQSHMPSAVQDGNYYGNSAHMQKDYQQQNKVCRKITSHGLYRVIENWRRSF